MMDTKQVLSRMSFLLFFVLGACSLGEKPLPATPTPTATITSPPTPIEAATPTSVPTPTPIPWSHQEIQPENLSRLVLINQWGRGSIDEFGSARQGALTILRTPLGLYVYEVDPISMQMSLLWSAEEALGLIVSPDEAVLAAAFPDGLVRAFDLESGAELWSFTHEFLPPPGKDPSWPDWYYEWWFEEYYHPTTMIFSPVGDLIAVGFGDSRVDVLAAADGAPRALLTNDIAPFPRQMGFSNDGSMLATSDGHIVIWGLEEQSPLIRIPNGGSISTTPFSPDNSLLVSYSGLTVYVYTPLPNGTLTYRYGISEDVVSASFAEDGSQLVVEVGDGDQVRTQLRALQTGKLVADSVGSSGPPIYVIPDALLAAGHFNSLQGLIISPEYEILAWGIFSGAYFLRLPDLQISLTYQDVQPEGELVVSNNGQRYAFCAGEQLWVGEVETLEASPVSHCGEDARIAISDDWVARGSGTILQLLDPVDGSIHSNLQGHARQISMLAFSRDGRYLMSGSTDPVVRRSVEFRLWSLEPSQSVLRIQDIPYTVIASAVSSDASLAAYSYEAYDGFPVMILSVPDGRKLALLNGIYAFALAFSPDGRLLAVGEQDGSLRFYQADTWEEAAVFPGHWGAVRGLVFSPDGQNLISFSDDGVIRVWGLPEP